MRPFKLLSQHWRTSLSQRDENFDHLHTFLSANSRTVLNCNTSMSFAKRNVDKYLVESQSPKKACTLVLQEELRQCQFKQIFICKIHVMTVLQNAKVYFWIMESQFNKKSIHLLIFQSIYKSLWSKLQGCFVIVQNIEIL